MNKFFKVIWNKSLGQKVIVAENAKCAGKSTSTTGNGVKTLVLGVAMVFGGQAWAGNVCDGNAASNGNSGQNLSSTATGWNSFVCGEGNSADGDNSAVFGISNSAAASHSIVLGNSSQVTALANSGVAIGHQAVTSGENGISLGYQVNAQAFNAIAIGYKATASESNSVALGAESSSVANSVALGSGSVASVANTISVGSSTLKRKIMNVADGTANNDAVNVSQLNTGLSTKVSQAELASGLSTKVSQDELTSGLLTKASQADLTALSASVVKYDVVNDIVQNSITLNGTTLTGLKEVALTQGSTAAVTGGQLFETNSKVSALDGRVGDTETVLLSLTQGQDALNATAVQYDSAAKDVISLKAGGTKITNVKAGDISSEASTDAVNGGQLYSSIQNVSSNLTQLFNTSAGQFASALGGNASFNNGLFTAPSYSIQGSSYTNVGSAFDAVDNQITIIKGAVELSSGTNLVAAQNYTDTKTAAALQDAIDYINDLKTTILNNANTYTDNAVSAGGEFVSVNGDESATAASATGTNSVAIGTNTTVTGNNSTAVGIGNTVSGNKSGAFGDPNTVTGNGSYVVGNDNTVSGDNTFVLGNNVNTAAANSVILGNNSTSDRDNTVSVGSSTNQRQITNVAAGTADTDAVNVAQLNQSSADALASANTYTDSRLAGLESAFQDYNLQNERRFQEVDKRFDRQGAMSAAMMNMAMSTSGLQGRNRIGVGAGLQGQEQAVAVGYQRMVNNNTSLTFSGALTREETSGGVGVGFGW